MYDDIVDKGALNLCYNGGIIAWIEYHNIKLVSILCFLILLLSTLSIQCNMFAVLASILSVIVVLIQLCRRDSYSQEFGKDDWTKVTNDKDESYAELIVNLPEGFQMSPYAIFRKDGTYRKTNLGEEYSSDGKKIIITANSYDERFDGIIVIGGPLRSGWKSKR